MTEQKPPQAGEYWLPKSGKPYLCIAVNDRGETVFQNSNESFYVVIDDLYLKHWRHEPLCDGFDWQPNPEEPAKPESSDADAIEALEGNRAWGPHYNSRLTEQIKAVIAIAKRAIQEPSEVRRGNAPPGTFTITPVESPDDWVTQDRVSARPEIDQRRYLHPTLSPTLWDDASCLSWKYPSIHGVEVNGSTLELRCRRKDLPPVESADDWVTQDRVPVRPNIDWCWWVFDHQEEKPSRWCWWRCCVLASACGKKHGTEEGEGGNECVLHVRCRRKDLPPMPLTPAQEKFVAIERVENERKKAESWMAQQYGEQPVVNRVAVDLIAIRDNRVIWREHGHTLFPGERLIYPDGNGGWFIEVPK